MWILATQRMKLHHQIDLLNHGPSNTLIVCAISGGHGYGRTLCDLGTLETDSTAATLKHESIIGVSPKLDSPSLASENAGH